MRNCLVYLFTSCVIFISCKKEESTPNPSTPGATTTQSYDVQIYALKQRALDNIGLANYYYHAAVFFSSPVANPANTTISSVNAGTISINGTALKLDNTVLTGPVYIDTTGSIAGNAFQLNTSGTSQFSATSMQYGQNYPSFADSNLIPSSVQINAGLSLQFNNCLNADSVVFTFADTQGNSLSKRYAVANNKVNLSVSALEFSLFTQTSNGRITVDILKNNSVSVGNKNYLITLERRYFKMYAQFY